MNRALKIVLGIEILLGVFWTLAAAMAQGAGGLAVIGLLFVIYPIFAIFFLFAAWVFWKHPDMRRQAFWIMALPVVFWFLPTVIRSMAGGVVTTRQFGTLIVSSVIAALAAAWIFPRRVAAIVPDFLVRSRIFNWLVLLALLVSWLFLVVVVMYVANGDSAGGASSGTAVAYALVLAALYVIVIGVGSFGVSTWAWLSLRGGFEATARGLNIAQLVVAAPGVIIGILVASWLAGQGHL